MKRYIELQQLSMKIDEALALASRLDQPMAQYLLRMVSLEVSEQIENVSEGAKSAGRHPELARAS